MSFFIDATNLRLDLSPLMSSFSINDAGAYLKLALTTPPTKRFLVVDQRPYRRDFLITAVLSFLRVSQSNARRACSMVVSFSLSIATEIRVAATNPSTMAMLAPWPIIGLWGCAASPRRATRPSTYETLWFARSKKPARVTSSTLACVMIALTTSGLDETTLCISFCFSSPVKAMPPRRVKSLEALAAGGFLSFSTYTQA
mmetsp:Transcript_31542/g.92490  ORF Transcript_31542/g.92490 Transcript_31542/m.92490 type:complete len:200 (-) Transcript_31542:893-1492(-)